MADLKKDDMEIDKSKIPLVLQPLICTGSAALSFVCPPLAIPFALLGSIYGEIKQQNTQRMLERLQAKYDELDSMNLVSKEFLESDQYVCLMMDILRRVYAFNTIEKRETVVEIYKKVLHDKIKYVDSDEQIFIDALEKINTQEIVILDFMDKNENALKTINSWNNFYELYLDQCSVSSLDKYRFKYFVSQLEVIGLVFCSDLFGFDANFRVLGLEDSRPCSAGITPMGKKFLGYLRSCL